MTISDPEINNLISSLGWATWTGHGVWPGNPQALARKVEALVLESLPQVKITQQRGVIRSHVGLKESATFKVFLGKVELARFSSPGDMGSGFYTLDEAEGQVFEYGQQVADALGVPLHCPSETTSEDELRFLVPELLKAVDEGEKEHIKQLAERVKLTLSNLEKFK